MVSAKNEGIILEKSDREFERAGVLNPAYIEVDGIGHMFYRAVSGKGISTIGYCELQGNVVTKRLDRPLLVPEYDFEMQGLEDPRIVELEDLYYLFYTAFDGRNATVAYATSKDLIHFDKQGIISPKIHYEHAISSIENSEHKDKYELFAKRYSEAYGRDVFLWEKNSFIFPKKINGRYALIHRILPGIQLICFDNFSDLTEQYWQQYFINFRDSIILEPNHGQETWVGGGCPPLETSEGWLFIFHFVTTKDGVNTYNASAALLDLNNPRQVIARLYEPLFSPEEPWEISGTVNNVVFPTGATIRSGKIYVYYGAADQRIGVRSFDLEEVLTKLKTSNVSDSMEKIPAGAL